MKIRIDLELRVKSGSGSWKLRGTYYNLFLLETTSVRGKINVKIKGLCQNSLSPEIDRDHLNPSPQYQMYFIFQFFSQL